MKNNEGRIVKDKFFYKKQSELEDKINKAVKRFIRETGIKG